MESGKPVLKIEERATNEGAVPLDVMWGHHIAFGAPLLAEGAIISAPAQIVRVDEVDLRWPRDEKGVRHDVVARVERSGEQMKYLLDLDEGWYALTNPKLDLGIGLSWSLDVFSCVWIWQEFNYTATFPWYGRAYAMALEPVSSLPLAHEKNTRLLRFEPGQTIEARLTAAAFTGIKQVGRVGPDGGVHAK